MSGEFRELQSRPYYFHSAIEEAANDAERGEHRVSQALQEMYKALAPVEVGAAWFEASDSGPSAPSMALVENWRAIEAAYKRLDAIRKDYDAIIREALSAHEKK